MSSSSLVPQAVGPFIAQCTCAICKHFDLDISWPMPAVPPGNLCTTRCANCLNLIKENCALFQNNVYTCGLHCGHLKAMFDYVAHQKSKMEHIESLKKNEIKSIQAGVGIGIDFGKPDSANKDDKKPCPYQKFSVHFPKATIKFVFNNFVFKSADIVSLDKKSRVPLKKVSADIHLDNDGAVFSREKYRDNCHFIFHYFAPYYLKLVQEFINPVLNATIPDLTITTYFHAADCRAMNLGFPFALAPKEITPAGFSNWSECDSPTTVLEKMPNPESSETPVDGKSSRFLDERPAFACPYQQFSIHYPKAQINFIFNNFVFKSADIVSLDKKSRVPLKKINSVIDLDNEAAAFTNEIERDNCRFTFYYFPSYYLKLVQEFLDPITKNVFSSFNSYFNAIDLSKMLTGCIVVFPPRAGSSNWSECDSPTTVLEKMPNPESSETPVDGKSSRFLDERPAFACQPSRKNRNVANALVWPGLESQYRVHVTEEFKILDVTYSTNYKSDKNFTLKYSIHSNLMPSRDSYDECLPAGLPIKLIFDSTTYLCTLFLYAKYNCQPHAVAVFCNELSAPGHMFYYVFGFTCKKFPTTSFTKKFPGESIPKFYSDSNPDVLKIESSPSVAEAEPVVEKTPKPVVEKTPKPVVEKTPKPAVNKTPEPVDEVIQSDFTFNTQQFYVEASPKEILKVRSFENGKWVEWQVFYTELSNTDEFRRLGFKNSGNHIYVYFFKPDILKFVCYYINNGKTAGPPVYYRRVQSQTPVLKDVTVPEKTPEPVVEKTPEPSSSVNSSLAVTPENAEDLIPVRLVFGEEIFEVQLDPKKIYTINSYENGKATRWTECKNFTALGKLITYRTIGFTNSPNTYNFRYYESGILGVYRHDETGFTSNPYCRE